MIYFVYDTLKKYSNNDSKKRKINKNDKQNLFFQSQQSKTQNMADTLVSGFKDTVHSFIKHSENSSNDNNKNESIGQWLVRHKHEVQEEINRNHFDDSVREIVNSLNEMKVEEPNKYAVIQSNFECWRIDGVSAVVQVLSDANILHYRLMPTP